MRRKRIRYVGVFLTPSVLAVTLYLLLAAVLLIAILVRTHGHFSYCLDDPYIHLALAQRIHYGLYGLNAGEPASPSSSILWPLLFVPFAGTAIVPWLPLVINLLCGAATAWLLGHMMKENFSSSTANPPWRTLLLSAMLVIALNLLGLTYTGLEHSLQVFLCVSCAHGAVRAMHGKHVPAWTLAAAVVLPSVRYESLLITVGFAIALIGRRSWRSALLIVAASAIVPTMFSLFLHRLGLPWFPLSVLVKSSYKFQDQSALPLRVARLVMQALEQSLFDLERLPQLIITALLLALSWKHRRTSNLRHALFGGILVGAVQVVLGPAGWFYRYEIYALAFTLLLLIAVSALPATEHMRQSDLGTRSRAARDVTYPTLRFSATRNTASIAAALLLGVAALALIYLRPLLKVPSAALGIHQQQAQLGRLMGEFYHEPVAVNDLGWVAFSRTPDQYTLDLYGLGSYEAFRVKPDARTPAWLDAITREHHVGLVAIYPEWFPQGVPANWAAVAKLCANDVDTSLAPVSRRVMLYRTPEGDPLAVQQALHRFRAVLPFHVDLQVQPKNTTEACR